MQPRQWASASALGSFLVSAAFVSSLTGQGSREGAATERIRAVDLAQKGSPPTGSHSVVIEHDQGLATHTIYRPARLDARPHPLLVWGEGGCAKNGLMFPEFLSEIASHGFVVLADGPPVMPAAGGAGQGKAPDGAAKAKGAPGNAAAKGKGGPVGNMLDGTALIAAVDWMAKETADPTSRFYGKVDTARVAAMGMSCGGLMSYGASADPRIATVGIWNSGLIQPDEKIFAGLHSPVIIVTGGESDIAYANGKRDFETMPARVPVFYGVHPSVGHGGTYNQDNGGAFGPAAVAWLKWQLMGDTSAQGKGHFVGDRCGLCTNSQWQINSRSLR
jgi:dienelactone hydrolase